MPAPLTGALDSATAEQIAGPVHDTDEWAEDEVADRPDGGEPVGVGRGDGLSGDEEPIECFELACAAKLLEERQDFLLLGGGVCLDLGSEDLEGVGERPRRRVHPLQVGECDLGPSFLGPTGAHRSESLRTCSDDSGIDDHLLGGLVDGQQPDERLELRGTPRRRDRCDVVEQPANVVVLFVDPPHDIGAGRVHGSGHQRPPETGTEVLYPDRGPIETRRPGTAGCRSVVQP